eukprot:gene15828-biopygen14286
MNPLGFDNSPAARSGHSQPGPCPKRLIRKALGSWSPDASDERFSGFADASSAPEWRLRVFGTSLQLRSETHFWGPWPGSGAWGAHKASAVPATAQA